MSAASLHMPAEWAPHRATWLAWPHNRSDWPGKMRVVPWVYGEMVRHIATGERVHVLVNDAAMEAAARSVLQQAHAPLESVHFHRWPTNRGWTRDMGPITVLDEQGQPVILDFTFNAWARYPGWQKDNAVAKRAAQLLKRKIVAPLHEGKSVVLEGGAIDVNGKGVLLTTEECLLDPKRQTRNPGFTKADYEAVFARYLGIKKTIWLGHGIVGDDTHGHVDDLCRFVRSDTVVLVQERNRDDANYRALAENRDRLQDTKLKVVELPMPAPLYFGGKRLPASYANFYIANAAVLVPTFNDPNDRIALGILSELITDRPVIGIHAVDLVLGLGTIHCLTQQDPAADSPAGHRISKTQR